MHELACDAQISHLQNRKSAFCLLSWFRNRASGAVIYQTSNFGAGEVPRGEADDVSARFVRHLVNLPRLSPLPGDGTMCAAKTSAAGGCVAGDTPELTARRPLAWPRPSRVIVSIGTPL